MRSLYVSALSELRSNPRTCDAPIIVAFEGQSNDASYNASETLRFTDTWMLNEVAGGMRAGVPKDGPISASMVYSTISALAHGCIEIAGDAIAVSTGRLSAGRRKSLSDLIELLLSELLAYRRDGQSGKFSGKSAGPDDLAIAFMMSIQWLIFFCSSDNPEHRRIKMMYEPYIWTECAPLRTAPSLP